MSNIKTKKRTNGVGDVEKLDPLFIAGENANGAATVEYRMEIPQIKIELPYNPSSNKDRIIIRSNNSTSGHTPQKN
jgi:hypothetical protein